MRIFLDLRTIRKNMTGVGAASLLLLKALIQRASNHEFHCLFLKGEKPPTPLPPNFFPLETDVDYEKHPSGEWWLHFTLPDMLKRLKIDVLHGTAFLIPWRKTSFRKIVTIHDIISYKYPEGYPLAFRHYLKCVTRFSAHYADRIIASSENTRRDLQERLGIRGDKIDIAPCYSFDFFKLVSEDEKAAQRKALNLPEKFMLYVGTLEKRKNQITLIKAFEIFKKRTGLPYKLVLIGRAGYKSDEILSEKEKSPYAGDIDYPDIEIPQEIQPYYSCAEFFVFPSFYEGFGMPVLEAMASGTPVIAAKTSSVPEVLGEAGMYYFPPDSAENLANIMMELALNPYRLESLRKKSLEQAAKFSSKRTAQALLSSYEKAQMGALVK
ncbi:glycosyltransferase family 4 protein [Candidatus Sumerlaeota bacterium]|nr:glycosyltransferase family 4 protein [Candidatus Sumerlaeota bacterium]